MNKLKSLLVAWADGQRAKIKMPTLATVHELIGIYNGQNETINSDAVRVLTACGIKTKPHGIGWKIVRE